jgi:hypothetical protein
LLNARAARVQGWPKKKTILWLRSAHRQYRSGGKT